MSDGTFKLAKNIQEGDFVFDNLFVSKRIIFYTNPLVLHLENGESLFLDANAQILVKIKSLPRINFDEVTGVYQVSYIDTITERLRNKNVPLKNACLLRAIARHTDGIEFMRIADIDVFINFHKEQVHVVRRHDDDTKCEQRIIKMSCSTENVRCVRFFCSENETSFEDTIPVLTEAGYVVR